MLEIFVPASQANKNLFAEPRYCTTVLFSHDFPTVLSEGRPTADE
jgi:hypothetical protein